MIKFIRNILILTLLLVVNATSMQGQERDRRADLKVSCAYNHAVSETGRLWLVTRCGKVHTADNIHSTWRTVIQPNERELSGPTFDRVAAFGDKVAVVAGFIPRKVPTDNPKWDYALAYDFVLRTTDRGMTFDTVFFGKGEHWINGFCFHSDGRLWMGSSQSTSPGVLFFSADSGRTFTTLRESFDTTVTITAIEMADSMTGMIGTNKNQLYATSDNWRTYRRLPTPKDQLHNKIHFKHNNISEICMWRDTVYVKQSGMMFCAALRYTTRPCEAIRRDSCTPQWHPVPYQQCMADRNDGGLWTTEQEDIKFIGVADDMMYISFSDGVVRESPFAKTDTCEYYTKQRPIEENWGWLKLGHGPRMWGSDRKSVYLTDNHGWYRIARLKAITAMKPDTTSDEHIILCLADGSQRRIDTSGHIEPYHFDNPLESFTAKGLQSLTIETNSHGCFHYDLYSITYRRKGDELYVAEKNFDKKNAFNQHFPVAQIEEALRSLSRRYDASPTASDFGLEDTTTDVNAILREPCLYKSTSGYGYSIKLVNNIGDTVSISGNSSAANEIGQRTRFPWLLPMHVDSRTAFFTTYQPCLWQALKPMIPDSMLLKNYLDNNTLTPIYKFRTGDLLFCSKQNSEMEKAIGSSTGEYTHVAIVEVDSIGRVWIIEANGSEGVHRIPYSRWNYLIFGADAYRLNEPFDTTAVIERAKSFIGQPYDDCFLPDNGMMYCSELVYEAYLADDGSHLFKSKPMNFRDSRGKMPKYWKRHFRRLGIAIPEGVEGTNPTDMSKSPLLKKVL